MDLISFHVWSEKIRSACESDDSYGTPYSE